MIYRVKDDISGYLVNSVTKMNRCCRDPLGPECIECGLVVCMACDDATDVYDRDGAPHKCHRACAGKAQDGADKASAEAPDFADEGSGPVGFATANDGSGPVGFANARAPMAVQTSVSPVLNMDELQAILTTSNDPHKLFTLSFATPPAVVGKLVKPAKTITKKPPKEKTEAKIDRFNPDIIEKASDNTDALDDDEKKAGMRSRCVGTRMDIVTYNIRPRDTQDGVDNVALYAHVLDCLMNVLFKRS